MWVRNESHVNDVSAFIALMREQAIVVNHNTCTGEWFVYPGCRRPEGTYAFCGGAADYKPLLAMLRACGKSITVNEQ